MKKTNAIITTLALFIVLIVLNFLAARHPLRLDLTQNRLYTLAPSTKKILAGLDDVVTVRMYFTKDLPPALQELRRDVDDLLAEFKDAAGARLQVEHVDPGASVIEEQQAAMIGIPPVQLNVLDRDKQEVAKVFLGIAILYGGKQEAIPVVRNIDSLEYDMAEAIIKASSKALPKIAWWQGEIDPSTGDGFHIIREALSRRYDITAIDAKTSQTLDPAQFAALVLVAPEALSDDDLFSIDQYLMGGGHLIALVDRFRIGPQLTVIPVETKAVELLMHYGATIEDALVLDQSNAMAAFSGGVVTYHMPYPYWPDIRRSQFDTEEPTVSGLESVVLPWTSPLILAAGDSNAVALAKSSSFSTQLPGKEIRLDPQSAGDALRTGKHEDKPLLALLGGTFRSYYAAGKAQAPRGRDVKSESPVESKIFVAGSSHWLSDRALTTFPSNAALFQNILDSFTVGNALIGIRSRENTSRPIVLLPDPVRLALKYINVAAGPLIVLAAGFLVFAIRRSKRRRITAAFRHPERSEG